MSLSKFNSLLILSALFCSAAQAQPKWERDLRPRTDADNCVFAEFRERVNAGAVAKTASPENVKFGIDEYVLRGSELVKAVVACELKTGSKTTRFDDPAKELLIVRTNVYFESGSATKGCMFRPCPK